MSTAIGVEQVDPATGEVTAPVTRLRDGRTIDEVWRQLREPFAADQIGKLPKWGKDTPPQSEWAYCQVCKQKAPPQHGHVDFVGHAMVTNRLNQVVGTDGWSYTRPERVHDDRGKLLAVLSEMTVLGHTKGVEVGGPAASATTYADQLKTALSDYICRAAMRFGIALEQWSKQELEAAGHQARQDADQPAAAPPSRAPAAGSNGQGHGDLDRITSVARARAYVKGQPKAWQAAFRQLSGAARDSGELRALSELDGFHQLITRTHAQVTQAKGGEAA